MNIMESDLETSLQKAVNDNQPQLVKSILEHFPKGHQLLEQPLYGDQHLPSLIWAVSENWEEMVRVLLAEGVDPGQRDSDGGTALIWASVMRLPNIARILLATGRAHPEYQDDENNTALMEAVRHNQSKIVKMLLKTGKSRPEARNNSDQSALTIAQERGYFDIMDLLFGSGQLPPTPIGRGTFGCVYRPPIPCQLPRCVDCVSKIVDEDEVKDEQIIGEQINQIDPKFLWHPGFLGVCSVPPVKDCSEYEWAVYYQYGGPDLYTYLRYSVVDWSLIFRNMVNVFQGLTALNQAHWIHNDIKMNNLVIDRNHRIRLIDFGSAIPTQYISKEMVLGYLNASYYIWPMDTMLLYSFEYSRPIPVVDESLWHLRPDLQPYQPDLSGRSIERLLQEILSKITHVSEILSKVDVYGLGLVLIYILSKYDYQIIQSLNHQSLASLRRVITEMTQLNPLIRPSMKEATKLYVNWLRINVK